jgi:hypothetical protein
MPATTMHSGIAHAGMSVGILGILGMPLGLNNKFAIKANKYP